MAENKTRFTEASVDAYLASRANEEQLTDCKALMAMCRRVTGHSPRMWGPSIVGYGTFKYTLDSGRTGEMPQAAFAIRGRDLVVYLMGEGKTQTSLLKRVGKYKMGKSCFYFKRLADLDTAVLEKLVANSLSEVKRRYEHR